MSKQNANVKTHKKVIRKGLSLYKTGASPYWYAQAWLSGEKKYVVRSTKETSRIVAQDVAEEILDDLKSSRKVNLTPKEHRFDFYALKLIQQQRRLSGRQKSKRFSGDDEAILNRKEDGVLEYFGDRDVTTITTVVLREYLEYLDDRRKQPLAPATKNRQLIVIRKVLNLAYENEIISHIPVSPKVPVKDKPRPSFSEAEYKLLLKTARQAIQENVTIRGLALTREIYLFILFMTHSFMRPTEGEIFSVRHRDIRVLDNPSRLVIKIAQGKTGFREANTTHLAPIFYEKMKKFYPEHSQDDFVFFPQYLNRRTAIKNFNRQFNYLLERADLKKTNEGLNRSSYSLRHYSLQTRLRKSNGKVNIFLLAKTAGTSVDQLERFYIKNLEFTDAMVENLQSFGK